MLNLVKACAVTLTVAAVAYLTGVNAFHPWRGLRITPASDLELGLALFLTMLATAVCIWRLLNGSTAGTELNNITNAMRGEDDLS